MMGIHANILLLDNPFGHSKCVRVNQTGCFHTVKKVISASFEADTDTFCNISSRYVLPESNKAMNYFLKLSLCTTKGTSWHVRRLIRVFDGHFIGSQGSNDSSDRKLKLIRLCACADLGDNSFQNFHLGRYIVGYTVGNLVLRRRISGAVKRDCRTYIRRYTSQNEIFEYGYPHSNVLLTFSLQKHSKNVLRLYVQRRQLHKTACQLHIFTCEPMKSDVT